jgi:hypothetical protein
VPPHSPAVDRLMPHFLRTAVTDAGLEDDFWEDVAGVGAPSAEGNVGEVGERGKDGEERAAALDTATEFGQRGAWRYATIEVGRPHPGLPTLSRPHRHSNRGCE